MNPTDQSQLSAAVAQCARKLGSGDSSALARLYDLAAARLVRYAQTLTRNRDDAEDALQGAMVRLARHPQSLASAQYPWAYFLRIVRNESLRILGRRGAVPSLVDVLQVHAPDENVLEREEHRLRIHAALKRLPAAQAEVVVLKIWEGMTFLEIAVVTGESPNTVASRYRYALSKLSRLLQPLASEVE